MTNFLNYLFEVSCIFAALYFVYYLLFSRLTFHGANRAFLVLMLPLSLVMPTISFGFSPAFAGNYTIPRFNEVVMLNQASTGVASDFSTEIDIAAILMIAYCIGLAIFVIKLVSNALKMVLLKQKSHCKYENGFLIISANVSLVFSCFNWIFVPNNKNTKCEETILQHEKVHASLWHTVDLILTELFIALLWFNPFVYFFRKSIKSVHEYQVDSILINSNEDKANYLRLIMQSLDFMQRRVGLYNYFYSLTIKNRVKMITNNKSSKFQLIRYSLIVPVMALLLMSFTKIKVEKPELFPIKNGEYLKITSQYGQKFINPFTKKEVVHSGIDIKANEGVNVLATAEGKVTKVFEDEGWGKLIVIDHGNGIESWYAHLKDFNVKNGESVKKGQVIGYVGNTGYSTAPHLHFEIRENGKPTDPLNFVKK